MSTTAQQTDFKSPLLAAGFNGDLYAPEDPQYTPSIVRFAKNAQKNAGLVAFVKSAADVSKIIKFANDHSAQGTPVQVVVRGGGHSTSGASSSDGGIVIDLSRHLNTVRIDEEAKLAHVGGGANWAAVDAEAIKYGLATTGGTVNHTGVGGLSLGGGYGWLMGEHGMVIDNIVQATIVTADGSILTVNSTSHPELYWGIRGGGCNFGCVTEFVYQLHPQRATVFAGPLVFPPTLVADVVSTLQDWYPTAGEKEAAMAAMTNKTAMTGPVFIVVVFYNGDEDEGRKRFAKLINLGPILDGTGMVPYEAVNGLQNQNFSYGANYHLTGTMRGDKGISPETASKIFDRVVEFANGPGDCAVVESPGIIVIWEFFNLKKLASIPADGTAFRMRTVNPAMPLIISWKGDGVEASKDAKARLRLLRNFLEGELKDTFSGGMGENDTGYGNYESGNPQSMDAAGVLYGANYPRLQSLKSKYDPNVFFRSWFPIQPANVVN